MPKKIYIRTFGCQMNNRDSEVVVGLFLDRGFEKAESADEADVVLFNTCSVRRHAEDRAISNMGALLKIKNEKLRIKNSKIFGIIGCTAQALKTDLFKRLPGLDLVCGPGRIYELPFLIEKARRSKIFACDNIDRIPPEIESHHRKNGKKAFVSIMRGCDNYCSYCIVPYTRGRERSRGPGDIIKEIEDLARRGVKEIMLLGQNVNSYKGLAYSVERIADSKKNLNAIRYPPPAKRCNFVELLGLVNDIDGIERIRFMTSHPKDAGEELFKAIKGLDKVAKELHLPLQSGSEKILKLMNRGYTAGRYSNLINELRRLIPDCRISTDIIVGFPSESSDDFKKTCDLVGGIEFDAAYIFKYSPRSPAKSSLLADDVPKEVKEKRHKILLDLQKDISGKKRQCG